MTYESPFAKAAMSEAGLCISGGKYKDITVVVGHIQHLSQIIPMNCFDFQDIRI